MIFLDMISNFINNIISHLPLIVMVLESTTPLIWVWLWWQLFKMWKKTLSVTFKELITNYWDVKKDLHVRTESLRYEIDRINVQLEKLKEKNQ